MNNMVGMRGQDKLVYQIEFDDSGCIFEEWCLEWSLSALKAAFYAVSAIGVIVHVVGGVKLTTHDYDIGYFEGLRNALIYYVRMPNKEQWLKWLEAELKNAKELRDESWI